MQLPHSEDLSINLLSRLFNNKNESYKLFWFHAIMSKLQEGKTEFTYDELLNEMIADAWYMVTEYHLNLGPKDSLEAVVQYISGISGMKSSEKRSNIIRYLETCTDKIVSQYKTTLCRNVPYRLQAPFMTEIPNGFWDKGGNRAVIEQMNQRERLLYYYSALNGRKTKIYMNPEWIPYLEKNQEIIKGWIRYCMITYLQSRNPSVPGIIDKLVPPQERKLEKVKNYWKLLLSIQPITDIYGNIELTKKDISIDHFVPWSYVAHDEFWNLHPTTKSINSSKSNNLPNWQEYFPLFCKQEYLAYQMIWKYEKVHVVFEECAKEHLNSIEIRHKLYRKGLEEEQFNKQLYDVVFPVYKSAKNCGFGEWEYHSPTNF